MYGLCKSCIYYRDEYKTPTRRSPKHCVHPDVASVFGEGVNGFITGIDIFRCDYHEMHDKYCGDVLIKTKRGGLISYVNTKERKENKQFKLTDNSKNIKIVYEQNKLEDRNKGRNSRSIGSDGCPF